MTILIVDDNAAVRRIIRGIVAELAGEIHECDDGRKALSAYTAHLPDYVLMDIEMKEMDGLAATGQIRAQYSAANIIMVTNYDDLELRQAASLAGACAYVVKDNLYEISRVIEKHKAANLKSGN